MYPRSKCVYIVSCAALLGVVSCAIAWADEAQTLHDAPSVPATAPADSPTSSPASAPAMSPIEQARLVFQQSAGGGQLADAENARVKKLVARLGSARYKDRQAAAATLLAEPLANLELIRQSADNMDPEIAARIPDIVHALESHCDAGMTLRQAIAVRHKAMDATVVGDLISLLANDDLVVRLCASAGLSRLTGQEFGFSAADPGDARKRGAAKAKDWWERNKATYVLKASTGPNEDVAVSLGNRISLKLALVPSGKFLMGSPYDQQDRWPNEGPQHEVTISEPFYMGVYHVTQEQYEAIMGKNPSYFTGEPHDDEDGGWHTHHRRLQEEHTPDEVKTHRHPVEMVSWLDAIEFCRKLSAKTGRQFGLPTEAQWEYACRAGSTARFYYGDDPDYSMLGKYAWYKGNCPDKRTHPVGQKTPNALGLFDMLGNVSQMCSDGFAVSYDEADKLDPTLPCKERVTRGGNCGSIPQSCRCANRYKVRPDSRDAYVGFRIIMTVPTK